MALKYRWSLTGSFICSILVALFWGANLGAVYPFVEVVLNDGKTIHQWADKRIDQAKLDIAKAEAEIKELSGQAVLVPAESSKFQTQISRKESFIDDQHQRIEQTQWMIPYIEKYCPNNPFQTLVYIVGFLVFATFGRGLFLALNMYLVARVGQRTILDLQNQVFKNVLGMEIGETGVEGTGDLIGRIRGETNIIGRAIKTLFGKTIREPLKMIACIAGAAYMNWRLLVFSCLVAPIAVYLMYQLARLTKRANRRAMEESANLLNRLYQALSYSRIVKAFSMEKHEQQRFENVANKVYRRSMKIQIYSAISRVNNEVLGVSMICLSILAGGYLVLNHQTHFLGIQMSKSAMTFGEIMTFFVFLTGVADPLRKMSDVYNQTQAGVVAADRVFPLVDQKAAVQNTNSPTPMSPDQFDVEYESVRFEYEEDRPILNGVSFKLESGQSLAIIGPNGCGKSTMINLLPRFFDPQSGTLRIGGVDIRNADLHELRDRVGYVTQQTMLFDDTIANNIRYGTPDATDLEVIAAARKAHADEFIRNLDEGYESNVGEHGGKLSGGQRQRLSLARAILKDPAILLLDEATSQIDPQSEMLIHNTLSEFIQGRTTLIVTHRMSTLELVDLIMVMDEGRIVDCGTHNELISRCEVYQHLRNGELKETA
jgi:ATP-binding cassette subfamily B protein/subfamily B ATP-binding cassette protein MsbA